MAKKKRKSSAASADKVELTEREKQVLYYLSKGYTTQEIADKLHVSYFTDKAHRNHLAKKLNAKNAIEIIIKGKKYLCYTNWNISCGTGNLSVPCSV